ncbi:heme-binding protein [Spongiactinospora sp. TRM90649]|uniref:GlcG/HbpS family heme-binding protein n=1 Tax=Spongiactinospora sp. TRM90649 TaxID=3031114 RepID=UPI0023F9DDE0|nr:heme-binding protein [Spongiactinospora sp. TRM90649]MDF5752104.1 heme-binding protein [Spongiactinospora sp. TRM90649]
MNLELALRMCEAAIKEAARTGAVVSVAVVDSGGHLMAFQRMDGAEIAGPALAPGKAYTAVAHRIATADLAPLVQPGGELYGLASAGDYVCFGGGIPLWAEHGDGERVVGGVGVSGGTVDQDVACAEAAAALWETS